MVTYVVLAKFTDQGIRNAKESPKRADAFKATAKTFGVTIKELLWTQGHYDVVSVMEAPDESSAMSLTLSLGALGGPRRVGLAYRRGEPCMFFSPADTFLAVAVLGTAALIEMGVFIILGMI
jgi:uncharacterized protein with GYD domain